MTKSDGVITEVKVRKIVKEELVVFEKKFEKKMDSKFQRQEERFDNKLQRYQNDILEKLDDIAGQLSDMREELAITTSLHRRVITPEDKVENLDQIHPGGQHTSA